MNDYTTPDWTRAALLTIDMQRDFTLPGAPAEIPGTMAVTPAIDQLVTAFRQADRPIIHVIRLYRPDGANVDACRRADVERGTLRAVLPGTDGAELVDTLAPDPAARLDADRLLAGDLQTLGPGEWAMYKPRWSAFHDTPLHAHLHRLGVTTVVVCGCNFPNCPRTTMYEASARDYRIVVATDAISGIYARGVQELAGIDVVPLSATACTAALGPTTSRPSPTS